MKKTLLLLSVAFATGMATLTAQVTNGLVAKYSFNSGNANDEVGANDGTITGAVLTTDRFGNADHAYEFDGVDDFLDLGASATIKPVEGSVSVWAKMTAISTSGTGYNVNPIFLSKNTSDVGLYIEGCALYVTMADTFPHVATTDYNTLTETYFSAVEPLEINSWSHYVVTYNNDSLSLFINGQLENRIFKGFENTFSVTEPVYVAQSGLPGNMRYFNGAIDDLRIYNRTLNQEEADSLYNEPNPNTVGIHNTTGLNNVIGIYPNPTEHQITFSAPANVQLTNVTGQILSESRNANFLNLSEQHAGVYFLTFFDQNRQVIQHSRVVKE